MSPTYRAGGSTAVVVAFLVALLLGASAAAASYPGRNGLIVFSKNGDIYGIQANGTGLHDITKSSNSDETQPAVSPDAKTLAFEWSTPTHTAEVFTSDMRGHHSRWITQKLSTDPNGNWLSFHEPTFSPDGKRIAFICNNYNFDGLCVTSGAGGPSRLLARCSSCSLGEPDWSKNNKIVFTHGLDLWVVNGSGAPQAHRLAITHIQPDDMSGFTHPSWSPDGKLIAFTVGVSNTAIDTVNASGGNHRRLIISPNFGVDPTDYDYPVWSPNGTASRST